MKKVLLIPLSLFLCLQLCKAQVQLMSSMRFDDLKLTMPLDTVNKILGSSVRVKDSKYDFSTDTVWTIYKSDSVRLVFDRIVNEKKQVTVTLQNIYSASRTVKTKSGIKYGDDKFEIIKKLDGSTLRVAPDWFCQYLPDKKMYGSVVLYDYDNYSIIIFHFYNNLLYAFECAYTPDAE